MKKRTVFILAMSITASVCFGQTTQPKLEEVKNNPKTTENAAKADVQVANNKQVTDDAAALKALQVKRKQHKAFRKKTIPKKTS